MNVDLAARIREITFKDLPAACFPTAEATNDLAKAVERLKRQNVAKPFPAISLTSFIPTWAKEVPGAEDGEEGESGKHKPKVCVLLLFCIVTFCFALLTQGQIGHDEVGCLFPGFLTGRGRLRDVGLHILASAFAHLFANRMCDLSRILGRSFSSLASRVSRSCKHRGS